MLKSNLEIVGDLLWIYNKLCDEDQSIKWVTRTRQKIAFTLFKNELFVYLLNKGFMPENITVIEDAKKHLQKENKTKIAHQKRRHDRRNDFSFNDKDWENTKSYFDYKCAYCGEDDKLTFDHFIPFSKGGRFTKGNILPACTKCNSSKRDRNFRYWYKKQECYDYERENKIYIFLENANKC